MASAWARCVIAPLIFRGSAMATVSNDHYGRRSLLGAPPTRDEEGMCKVRGSQTLCRLWWNFDPRDMAGEDLAAMDEDGFKRSAMAWSGAGVLADPIADYHAMLSPLARHLQPPVASSKRVETSTVAMTVAATAAIAFPMAPPDLPRCAIPLGPGYLPPWDAEVGLRPFKRGDASRCFLPLSRPYLLSYFGAAIEMHPDDAAALAGVGGGVGDGVRLYRPGETVRVRFRACAADAASIPPGPTRWRDVWTRKVPPGHARYAGSGSNGSSSSSSGGGADSLAAACPHLALSARLVEERPTAEASGRWFKNAGNGAGGGSDDDSVAWGAQSIRSVAVAWTGSSADPASALRACTWEAAFAVPHITGPGAGAGLASGAGFGSSSGAGAAAPAFRLEVSNVWQHGGYGAGCHDKAGQTTLAERLRCEASPGFGFRGQPKDVILAASYRPPDVLARGGNYMDCCDR